ncbi:amidohydrolase family protein [Legionella sp. CNM-4043-24]|uniref:amidohydrolase family protein n=1 Tax=Legionella sp. CNM-4043-24 TaxID=3421646 RepID=UPI00403AE3DD
MQTIDLETHFYTKAAFDYLESRKQYPRMERGRLPGTYNLRFTDQITLFHDQHFMDLLCDLGDKRIQLMDEAGLDIQVLSFSSPGIDECTPDFAAVTSMARDLNDHLHETIKKHPARFMGFATLAPYEVANAVSELERCVTQLGLVGWLTHSNFGEDDYLDDLRYWPLLEAAEAMNIPIYLHPTTPLSREFGKYGFSLAGPALGFQFDTSLCLMRMICAGVFDRFPNLRIILGHLGETLPFLIPDRIDWAYTNPNISVLPGFIEQRPDIRKTPSEVLLNNVYVTTSGRFSKATLDYTIQVMGEDRVMLATDHPYENLKSSMDFIRGCALPDKTMKKICFENAHKLGFKL